MAAEITTIARVYLKPEQFRKSMYHTARAPAPGLPNAQPGADQPMVELTFEGGIAFDVPTATYDIFAALGIATTEIPMSPAERRFRGQ